MKKTNQMMLNKLDLLVIGGGGHVGLPLALVFANSGLKVGIYDINIDTLSKINNKIMPFKEDGAEELLNKTINRTLFTYNDPSIISRAKNIVVVIGTPVDEHLNPNFTLMENFFVDLIQYIKNGQNIILRSTVFPGTTQRVHDLLIKNKKKVNISFCPERVAEGHAIKEIRELPQIISGTSSAAISGSKKLFRLINKEIIILTPIEAELAKLFTNTYRYINFAIANQFFMIAKDYNIDFNVIHNAVTWNYPRAKSFPKPGFAAGPCLFKDTMQLASFNNNNFFLGHSAMLINEGLPNYIVSKIKKNHDLKKLTVGILGMAFKANSDDKRESLAYKLRKICQAECKELLCSDVYIQDHGFVSAKELVNKCDLIIIGAPHKEYRALKIPKNKLIDIWGSK